MPKNLIIVGAAFLTLHGLIHLMGTAAYLKLAEVQGLPYKTTFLNGRLDLGDVGMRIFGALWVFAAVGFLVAAFALLNGWENWQTLLAAVTIFSLAITVVDWTTAFAGAIINIAILALLFLIARYELQL